MLVKSSDFDYLIPPKQEQGTKYDQDKPRVDLIDSEWLEGVGTILGFGARKYGADNWRGGITVRRILGGILRHLYAIMRGEDNDPESGKPHSWHASCGCMFLSWMMAHRKDLDDRFKEPKRESNTSMVGNCGLSSHSNPTGLST